MLGWFCLGVAGLAPFGRSGVGFVWVVSLLAFSVSVFSLPFWILFSTPDLFTSLGWVLRLEEVRARDHDDV